MLNITGSVITLEDNGCGIPENIIDTFFEPFVTEGKEPLEPKHQIYFKLEVSAKSIAPLFSTAYCLSLKKNICFWNVFFLMQ